MPLSEIELLRRTGVPEEAILHSIRVAEKALEVSERVKVKVDRELVRRGALFHDIGKARTTPSSTAGWAPR